MSALKRWDKVLGAAEVPTHDPGLAPEYLRFESLGPWMPMPKLGQSVWYVMCGLKWEVKRHVWQGMGRGETVDYWVGIIHPTRESAEEWIKWYGAAWLEGEE